MDDDAEPEMVADVAAFRLAAHADRLRAQRDAIRSRAAPACDVSYPSQFMATVAGLDAEMADILDTNARALDELAEQLGRDLGL